MQNANLGPFFKVMDCLSEKETRFIRYDGGAYILTISIQKNFMHLQIFKAEKAPKYAPDMYIRCDSNYLPARVEIQTTSYGALSLFETEQVVHSLKHAVFIAGVIQEKFIGPIRAGNFVFGDMISPEEEE